MQEGKIVKVCRHCHQRGHLGARCPNRTLPISKNLFTIPSKNNLKILAHKLNRKTNHRIAIRFRMTISILWNLATKLLRKSNYTRALFVIYFQNPPVAEKEYKEWEESYTWYGRDEKVKNMLESRAREQNKIQNIVSYKLNQQKTTPDLHSNSQINFREIMLNQESQKKLTKKFKVQPPKKSNTTKLDITFSTYGFK